MGVELIRVGSGVELRVIRHGAGTAKYLLVHGLASNARLWDGVGASLQRQGHSSIAVDLRGHGRSVTSDGPYDVATVANDVAQLIDALGLQQPIVAGQSWGGNVVLELAHGHRQLVAAIALIDGGWLHLRDRFARWEDCAEQLAPPPLEGTPLSQIEGWLRANHADWPDSATQGTLANFEIRADDTIRPWLDRERHIEVLAGLWAHEPRRIYPEVDVPVLAVPAYSGDTSADADKRALVDEAIAALPRGRVATTTVPSAHDIHAQRPDEIADLLIELSDG